MALDPTPVIQSHALQFHAKIRVCCVPESQCAESFTRYEHGRFNGPADHSLPPIPCPLRSRRRASSSVLGAIGLQRKSVRVPRRTGVPVSSLPTLYSIASALECILQRLCQDQHAQTSTDKRMYLHAYERTMCMYLNGYEHARYFRHIDARVDCNDVVRTGFASRESGIDCCMLQGCASETCKRE